MKTERQILATLLVWLCTSAVNARIYHGHGYGEHNKMRETHQGQNSDKPDIVTRPELDAVQAELEDLRQQLVQYRLATKMQDNSKDKQDFVMRAELNQALAVRDQEINELRTAETQLRTDIRHDNNTHHIAFTVGLTHTFGPVTIPTTVPFDRVLFDIGGGWNDVVHTFIAPEDGVYFFAATILSTSSEHARCSIVHTDLSSGEEKLVSMFGGASTFMGQANHVIIRLQRGDGVTVQLDSDNYVIHSSSDHLFNTMSGFYLFPQFSLE